MGAILTARHSLPAVLAFAAACSYINDFDLEQCKEDKDCAKRGTPYKNYVCLENLCKATLACSGDTADADCSKRLPNYICDDTKMECVPPDCLSNEECEEELGRPTATCTNGRCEDPKWG